jgi:hypothetical protein
LGQRRLHRRAQTPHRPPRTGTQARQPSHGSTVSAIVASGNRQGIGIMSPYFNSSRSRT